MRCVLASSLAWPLAAQDLFLKPHPTTAARPTNTSLGVGHDHWVFSIALVQNNNLCVDAGDGNNGDRLMIWECNGRESQLWFFDDGAYAIQWAGDSSKCVDAGDMQAGNQLYLWDCNGFDQQFWSYDPDMWTVFLANGKGAERDASLCMDLAGGDETWGTAVEVWDCNSLSQQMWWLKAGITLRLGVDDPYCIDLPGGDTSNGTPLWLWSCNGQASQQWEFTDFQIKFAGDTSKCIDASGMDAGNQLMLWDCNGFDQQTWGYDSDSGTLYLANSAADASLCLDVAGGAFGDGATLQIWDCTSCWNQVFSVIGPVDGQAMGQADRASSSLGVSVGDCPPYPSNWDNLLPRCSDGDQYGWPVFNSQAELQASEWGQYFEWTYGEIPSRGYPICTYGQVMLYRPHLDGAGVTPPNKFKDGCPGKTNAGQWYKTMTSAGSEASWSNWIWNPNLSAPQDFGAGLPSDVWVEVHHKSFSVDGSATWLYYAAGSGIWAWLGNTQAYPDHKEAVADIMGKQCGGECSGEFEKLYEAMRIQGRDTIQFLYHDDMNCGNGAIEIVDPAGSGKHPCGQDMSGLTRFKAGWGASADCICDNSAKDNTLNCDGFGIRAR